MANKLHYSLRIVVQFTIQKQQGHKRVPGKLNPAARDNSTLFSNNYFIRKTFSTLIGRVYIAEEGFDPPTSGLWAQHASAAPLC